MWNHYWKAAYTLALCKLSPKFWWSNIKNSMHTVWSPKIHVLNSSLQIIKKISDNSSLPWCWWKWALPFPDSTANSTDCGYSRWNRSLKNNVCLTTKNLLTKLIEWVVNDCHIKESVKTKWQYRLLSIHPEGISDSVVHPDLFILTSAQPPF